MKKNYNKYLIYSFLVLLFFALVISADDSPTSENVSENDVTTNEIIIEDVSEPVIEEVKESAEEIANRIISQNDFTLNYQGNSRTINGYVCLTFDDGPSKKNTQNILDLLKEYNAVATFFEVGYLVEDYPELIQAEIDLGCEVENHTYSHINMKSNSKKKVLDEIQKCSDAIYNVTGSYPEFVRPPYGSINKDALAQCGLSSITWSIDTRDWESRNVDKIMQKIYEAGNLNGQVILMHSTHQTTVEALEVLLPYLRDNHYRTVTLKELYQDVFEEEYETGETYTYSYFIKRKEKMASP